MRKLREAAENYRGYRDQGVRADAEKLDRFDEESTGFTWVAGSDLDAVTASIRGVCGADSSSGHRDES